MWVYSCILEATKLYPDPPVIDCKEQIQGEVGSSLKISCEVRGVPEPTVIWAKDEKEIKASAFNQLQKKEQVYSLVIVEVRESSLGNYSCTARNKHGTST